MAKVNKKIKGNSLILNGSISGELTINAAATTTSYTTTWPNAVGSDDQILYTNSSGVLSWNDKHTVNELKQESTGVLSGGVLSINVDDTKFDVSDGSGFIRNPSTGTETSVSWSGLTAQSTTYSGIITFVSINSSSTLVYSSTEPTQDYYRDNIFLGVLVHVNGTNINAVDNQQLTILNPVNQIKDLAEALGFLNIDGNAISVSNLLTIQKSAGTLFAFGSNYENDIKNPHIKTMAAIDTNTGGTFQYRMQDGSGSVLTLTNINPDIWDDGSAYGSAPAVGNNNWTIQRVFLFIAGNIKIQPGQVEYNSFADALNGARDENFIVEPSIDENGTLIAQIIVEKGTTDLSNATFIQISKFGAVNGSAGALNIDDTTTSTTTLWSSNKISTEDALRVLLAGSSGGQDIIGGTDASDTLTLESTSNATKGTIDCKDPTRVDDIDTLTATTMLIGKSTATKVEIADASVRTEIQGPIDANEGIVVKTQNTIRFEDNTGGEYVEIKAPTTIASNFTITLPTTDGADNNVLAVDGSGNLDWTEKNRLVSNLITSDPNPITSAYHFVKANATSGAFNITLPDISSTTADGLEFIIVKSDSSANAVTVQRSGSDTIDGSETSYALSTQYNRIRLIADGTNNTWLSF
jgi:hypothetical protein